MRLLQEYFILDGLFSGIFNYASTQETNSANKAEAYRDRDWQQYMYNQQLNDSIALRQDAWNREDEVTAANWQREDEVRQEGYDREDALLAQQHQREDTAYVRSVADAQAAGLSPLAVVGGSGASSTIAAPQGSYSAGSYSTGSGSAPSVGEPATYRAIPALMQMDSSSLIGAVMSQKKLDEDSRHNKAMESQAQIDSERQYSVESAKLSNQASQFAERLEFDKETQEGVFSRQDKEFLRNVAQFTAEMSQKQQFFDLEMSDKDKQRAWDSVMSSQKQTYDMYAQMCKDSGLNIRAYPVYSLDDYYKGLETTRNELFAGNRKFLNDSSGLSADYDQSDYFDSLSESVSSGQSNGASAGLGVGKSSGMQEGTKSWNQGFSDSLNGSVSASASQSNTNGYSMSRDQSTRLQELKKQCYGDVTYPVLVTDYADWSKNWKRN